MSKPTVIYDLIAKTNKHLRFTFGGKENEHIVMSYVCDLIYERFISPKLTFGGKLTKLIVLIYLKKNLKRYTYALSKL